MGYSQAVAGIPGFLSSCDGYLVEPLVLHKGSLLSSFKRGLGIALEKLLGKRTSSRVKGGILWLFSSYIWKLGVPFQLWQGPQEACRVASWK